MYFSMVVQFARRKHFKCEEPTRLTILVLFFSRLHISTWRVTAFYLAHTEVADHASLLCVVDFL